MNRRLLSAMMLMVCLAGAQVCCAEELITKPGDNIQKILEGYLGKRVTVRIQGNDELTGKVRAVTQEILHLGELAGRDYYDAVLDVKRISVVIVRVKEK